MHLAAVSSPRVFPPSVVCRSARLLERHHRLHHAAGRACASEAIRLLTGQDPAQPIARGPAGEPIWPPGLTGSITHTGDFVSAAVARMTAARGLGLDTEQIASAELAGRIASLVARPDERSSDESIPFATWITLLFSIKEASFKCLYPIARQRFYYHAVRVNKIDIATGTFEATLLITLPGFPEGHKLEGRFEVDQNRVHAGLCLPGISAPPY